MVENIEMTNEPGPDEQAIIDDDQMQVDETS